MKLFDCLLVFRNKSSKLYENTLVAACLLNSSSAAAGQDKEARIRVIIMRRPSFLLVFAVATNNSYLLMINWALSRKLAEIKHLHDCISLSPSIHYLVRWTLFTPLIFYFVHFKASSDQQTNKLLRLLSFILLLLLLCLFLCSQVCLLSSLPQKRSCLTTEA